MSDPASPFERFSEADRLLAALLTRPPGEREAVLAELRSEDPELGAEMAELLRLAEEEDALLVEGGALAGELGEAFAEESVAHGGATLPVASGLLARRFGPWRIVRELGRGGMAVVYLAERADGAYEQQVALKLLQAGPQAAELVERFERERQILASLKHSHIAGLIDGGLTEDGQPWFAMEYVEGSRVDRYCDERRLSVDERLALFIQIVHAVQAAHRALVVHRDLKPSNILVTEEGEPRLLDFGIAKPLDPEADAEAATRTLPMLTPEYASPEQVQGEPVTTASDVYQLGLLLHELLTGARAQRVVGRSAAELERVVLEQTPSPPSVAARTGDAVAARAAARRTTAAELARRLSGDLDAIVLQALRKESERRYASAAELAEDVRRHLVALPVTARPDSLPYRASRFVRRHALGSAAVTAVAFLTAGLVGFYTHSLRQERDRTEDQRRLAVSREVAAEAVEMLTIEPRLALALAIEAVELGRSREAVAVLRRALVTPIPRFELPGLAHDLAVDPTGRYVAVAGPESTAGLWDLKTGERIHALEGHVGYTATTSFSPDGRLLLTTDRDGGVRIWDVTNGTLIRALRRGTRTLTAWSPDGRYLFTASNAPVVRRWDVDTGREVTPIETPARVRAVRVTPDGGSVLAWNFTASEVYVLDVSTGDLLATLDGHETVTFDVDISPDGRHAVSVGNDGTARIWDLHTGAEVTVLDGFGTWVWFGRFSPDGTLVLVGDEDGNVRLAEVPSGRTRIDERAHRAAVVDALFSPHDAVAVTVSVDGNGLLWDLEAGRPREVLALNGASLLYLGTRSLAFTPDGKQVLTQGAAVEVWDVPPGPRMVLRGHDPDAMLHLDLSRDGTLLATGGSDGVLHLWDLTAGEKLWTLEVPESRMRGSFSPDGSLLLTANPFRASVGGKTMPPPTIWDVATGKQVRSLPVLAPRLPSCSGVCQTGSAEFSPDGTTILTSGVDGVVRLWNAATGELLRSMEPLEHSLRTASWSADGKLVAGSLMIGNVSAVPLWDGTTGKLVRELKVPSNGVAFSPSGDLVAAVGYDPSLWDVETGQRVGHFRHAAHLLRAAWSPDGQFLLTAGGDGAHLWDVESQRRLRSFTAHGTATAAAFTPDGTIVIGAEGAALFYDCTVCGSVEELLETARDRSTRELTPLERQRFLHGAENRAPSGGGGPSERRGTAGSA